VDSSEKLCLDSQTSINEYERTEHDSFILGFALQGAIEVDDGVFGSSQVEAAARHIGDCERCQQWLDTKNPEYALLNKRRARYCCGLMFHSVTDEEADTKFKFGFFRDEACWTINGRYEFAQFCPWCGKALPDKGFE
jgi:hypothetical protein